MNFGNVQNLQNQVNWLWRTLQMDLTPFHCRYSYGAEKIPVAQESFQDHCRLVDIHNSLNLNDSTFPGCDPLGPFDF
jgi:hypothetical protein